MYQGLNNFIIHFGLVFSSILEKHHLKFEFHLLLEEDETSFIESDFSFL